MISITEIRLPHHRRIKRILGLEKQRVIRDILATTRKNDARTQALLSPFSTAAPQEITGNAHRRCTIGTAQDCTIGTAQDCTIGTAQDCTMVFKEETDTENAHVSPNQTK